MSVGTTPPVRAARLARLDAVVERRPDGVQVVRCATPLPAYPPRCTDLLDRWAAEAPGRTFLAERGPTGEWVRLTYAEARRRARRIAAALLARGLTAERPVVMLSGNSIAHALLAFGAMYAGVPHAPLAPAYALQSRDLATLRYLLAALRPALVLAAEGAPFARALREAAFGEVDVVVAAEPGNDRGIRGATPLAVLEEHDDPAAVDAALARVGPDTAAKVLFTSGSTARPKGVITTHRMLCANQAQLLAAMPLLADPPVLCDWLPWNHVFGGSHNLGLVLHNGGTLYLDEGRPTPAGIAATVRNLREVAPTAYFNVPRGYEMLVPHLRDDARLRETFFSRVEILFYAAAGLGQSFWDELQDLAVAACGERVRMVTALGATETAPFAMLSAGEHARAGMVGLPAPGVEVKLAPTGTKLEARVRGPNVTPGYWRDEERTRAAFDDEGFIRLGDALRWVDPDDPALGLRFDGRLDEDFKLSTGTWVNVGLLRERVLAALGGLAQDAVLAAPDRAELGVLLVPNLARCRALAPGFADDATAAQVLADPRVRGAFTSRLAALARESTGSSTRVARALLLAEPPSIDAGELTDKGSLNQRAVLGRRAALVDALYDPTSPLALVIEGRDAG